MMDSSYTANLMLTLHWIILVVSAVNLFMIFRVVSIAKAFFKKLEELQVK